MFSPRPTLSRRVRGQSLKSRQVSTDRKDGEASMTMYHPKNSGYKMTSHRVVVLKEKTIESDNDISLSARDASNEILTGRNAKHKQANMTMTDRNKKLRNHERNYFKDEGAQRQSI